MRWGRGNVSHDIPGAVLGDGQGPAHSAVDGAGEPGPDDGYGRACTCGPTALDQALFAVASQLVDQVIAPRRDG
ncbi:hypothetical protein GCM10010297_02710 [Streptomyces malachitofuscus]|nr:hypothetical protein GCM10010297_02710 [Streptomyces malachitofuscus]